MGNQHEKGLQLLNRKLTRRSLLIASGTTALGVAISLSIGCEGSENPTWPEFTSKDYPYRISYPSNWQIFHIEEQGLSGKEFDEFSGEGQVIISAISTGNLTLEEYKDQVIGRLKESIRKSDSPDTPIYDSPGAKIDGIDAWTIRHQFDFLGTENEQIYYVFLNQGLAWSITFSALVTEFQEVLPTFSKMVDSFRFLNRIPSPQQSPTANPQGKLPV